MRLSGRIFIEGKDLYLNPANGVLLRNKYKAKWVMKLWRFSEQDTT
jgi:hypothetical protein